MIDVVCVGILVADVIARPVDALPPRGELAFVDEISLRGGGCALSTASALTRLGARAAVAGKVGADPLGDHLIRLLDERGVDRRGVLRDATWPTSTTVVVVSTDGERTFLHLPGANAQLRAEELDRDLLFSGRSLHVGGALVMPDLDGEPTAALLAEARQRTILTSLDTAFDAGGRWERLLPCLAHLDLITPSLTEARAVSGERDPAAVAAWFRARGVCEVALTMGEAGCFIAGEDVAEQIAGIPVRAVDGTGSGDAFAAGLLYGRLAGWPLAQAARFANAAGALSTTAVGAVEGLLDAEGTCALAGLAAC